MNREQNENLALDATASWRHFGAMTESIPSPVRDLDRINLRLPPETFAAVDAARLKRPGHISRNTWLTEAVQEKLAREAANAAASDEDVRLHG